MDWGSWGNAAICNTTILLMTVGMFYSPSPLFVHGPFPPFHKSTSSDHWPRSVLKVKVHLITGGPHARSDQCTWLLVEGMNSSAFISLDTFPHLAFRKGDGTRVVWRGGNKTRVEMWRQKGEHSYPFVLSTHFLMVHEQCVRVPPQIFSRGWWWPADWRNGMLVLSVCFFGFCFFFPFKPADSSLNQWDQGSAAEWQQRGKQNFDAQNFPRCFGMSLTSLIFTQRQKQTVWLWTCGCNPVRILLCVYA